jgi:hypothetical protein
MSARALAFLSLAALSACATTPVAPPPATPAPVPTAQETPPAFQAPFDDPTELGGWTKVRGAWEVADRHLKGSEIPEQKHNASLARLLPIERSVITVSFRFEQAEAIILLMNHKGEGVSDHVARVAFVQAGGKTTLSSLSGWGGTTKTVATKEAPFSFQNDRWYQARVTVDAGNIAVDIDGQRVIEGALDAQTTKPKNHLALVVRGPAGLFDALQVAPKP